MKHINHQHYKKQRTGPKAVLMLALALAFCFSVAQAQEAVTSGGGDLSGEGGTTSFSIGQMFFTAIEGEGGLAIQGVQQPLEWVITDVNDELDFEIAINAYPNPTSNNLFLEISNYERDALSYQLFNLEGELVEDEKIVGNSATVNMGSLPAAVYMLRITEQNKVMKTIRVIKH